MEKPTNQLIERSQETQNKVPIFSLKLLRDKLEYFNVKADFFENQTLIFNEIINKVELKDMELLKEEQELTDKLAERAEVKNNLVYILKGLKNQRKVKTHETIIRTNGFYHCSECPFRTNLRINKLQIHINAVHRKLKPWKCSVCNKGKRIKTYHLKHLINILFLFQVFHEMISY